MPNTILHAQNRSTDTTRLPSPAIWSDCPWRDINDPRSGTNGLTYYDDFQDFPLPGTLTTEIAVGKYKVYAATGCTVVRTTTINSVETPGGALSITMDTDNDEAAVAQYFPSYLLSGLTSNSGKLWFEVCYAQNSVATNMAATFIGLGECEQYTLAANTPMNSGDAIANSGAMIGFRIEEDGLGVVDTVYSDRATSFTNIGDTEGGTLSAYTFKKLGFKYDPSANPSTKCIRFFTDNTECSTALSNASLQALTYLDANCLGFMWAVAADSAGTSFASYLKWVRIAQILP